MKSLRAVLGAVLVEAIILAGSPSTASGAAETFVELTYETEAGAGCVGEIEFRRMVQEQLHYDPFRRDAEGHMTITLRKTDAGFEGRITWTEASGQVVGERLLSSRRKDCRDIAANVAFAVAVQIELIEARANETAGTTVETPSTKPPAESSGLPSPQPPGDRSSPPTTKVEPSGISAELPPPQVAHSPSRPALSAGVGMAAALGIAPDPTAIGRVFASVQLDRVSAEIAADAALPVTRRLADGSGVVVSAMGASLAGCGQLSPVVACLLGRLGRLHARGLSVDAAREPSAIFAQVGARLGMTGKWGPIIASFHADGLWMLSDWNVALNQAVVWSVPRVGGLLGADVAMRFF